MLDPERFAASTHGIPVGPILCIVGEVWGDWFRNCLAPGLKQLVDRYSTNPLKLRLSFSGFRVSFFMRSRNRPIFLCLALVKVT